MAVVALSAGSGVAIAGTADSPASGQEREESRRPERAFTVYVGFSSPDDFTSILTSPWSVSFEDTQIFAATGSHEIFDIGETVWLDAEVGVGRRTGDSDAWDFFGLLFLRWDGLPWNEYLYTSLGVGIGPSFATEISETERRKSGNDGSRLLNMLVPEIAVALPDHEDTQLVFRLHHRSGVFGLFNGVSGGSTFVSTGVRIGF